ncbi:glycoside hydrolase [Phyllobacterium zundukense]|uniref:Glycoside hydrolase n=1 Tax=Phyllobacterium zundukense TaxID=1867719 RepID=A0ACD4D569_9HYPH|nr:glycoside hydrolase [Phyllobacterium zundukense]UXN60843.1 glycoside hydrolase [Phyllobacterium zundukense]
MAAIIAPFLAAAVASAVLLAIIMRALPAGFLGAAVTERSNHTQAARQLGGLAIVPGIIATLWIFGPAAGLDRQFLSATSLAAALLWVVGFLDDRHHLPETIRLASQVAASAIAVHGLGADFRLLPELMPFLVERGLLVLALVYFINLTNFMDGLDLMVVSGLGIPLALLAGFSIFGLAMLGTGSLAASIAGGLLGFAVFNRPKASVFLGDSGSLPIGLLSGLAFFRLGHDLSIWAGLVLPLFFIADATSTLFMRLAAGDNIFAAHSKHAYQVAKRSGWSVWGIVISVGVLNVVLGACAVAAAQHGLFRAAGILAALMGVGFVLLRFRAKPR